MRRLVWLFAAAIASPAVAAPCDRFQEPLAYNACLAKQGPAAHAVHVGAVPAHLGAAPRPKRGGATLVITRPRGRSELVFSPRR